MITVAIWAGGHDNSITILKDEKLLAFIPEERFSRIKYDSSLPFISLQKILKYTNYIDNLIISNELQNSHIFDHLKKLKITIKDIITPPQHDHHIFHAFSGFTSSGFNEAICLTIDGFGGITSLPNNNYCVDTTNFYYISNPYTFKNFYSNKNYTPNLLEQYPEEYISSNVDLNYNLDIGMMYGSVCRYLGWNDLEAGKLMGLSPYGKLNNNIPKFLSEDTLYANMNLFNTSYNLNYPFISSIKKAKNNPNTQIAKDLAYSMQKTLEYVIYNRILQALKNSTTKNIVLSGGCALNVVNNYKLKKKFPDNNFYIDPLGSDIGQSYGMAKYYYYQLTKSIKLESLKSLYQGISYSKEDLLNSIKKYV